MGKLKGHKYSNNNVTFSPGGNKLATCSDDMTIRLWEFPNTHVSITTLPVDTPVIGDKLTLTINISNGENITGFQAKLSFDETALSFVESLNGDYLSDESFSVSPVIEVNQVTIGATSLIEGISGEGTLATLLFKFIGIKESTITVSDFVIVNSTGERLPFLLHNQGTVTVGVPRVREDINLDGIVDILDLILVANSFGKPALRYELEESHGDVNNDGVVDIKDIVEIMILNVGLVLDENTGFKIDESIGLEFEEVSDILSDALNGSLVRDPADVNMDGIIDIIDLVLVAGALGKKASAPSIYSQACSLLSAKDVQNWITQSQHLNLTDPITQRGILFLKQLLASLTPKKTVLLQNYPNPFNPETWMPYHLEKSTDVTFSVYTVDGKLVRRLNLGLQAAGIYGSRTRAVHWDGKNEVGEAVASGIYFYTLIAGDFSATRRMLILK